MKPSRASWLAVAVSILPIELSYGSQVIPAAAERITIDYDRVIDVGDIRNLTPGPGGTVQFNVAVVWPSRQGVSIEVKGRFATDFTTSKPRLIEDAQQPLPVVKHRPVGTGRDFELVDAAGVVRYKGTQWADHHFFSPGFRRFVYLSRSARLTVVDLRTFKAEEVGKAEGDAISWDVTDRHIIVGDKLAYDFKAGVVCASSPYSSSSFVCEVSAWAEPPLDYWFRPLDPPVRLRAFGEQDFELVDRSGAVRFKSSTFKDRWYRRYFSPDGRWFLFADRSDRITLVDLSTFKTRVIGRPGSKAFSHEFSAGGRYVRGDFPDFYETETGHKVDFYARAVGETSPDDRWAVIPEFRGGGRMLYSFDAGTTTVKLTGTSGEPMATEFSPSGRYVFLHEGNGGRYAVYEVPSGRLAAESAGTEKYAGGAMFSPDERFVAVGRPGKNTECGFELMDMRHGVAVPFEFPGECRWGLREIRFTGDGRWLAFNVAGLKGWRLRYGLVQRAVIAELGARELTLGRTLASQRLEKLAESAIPYDAKIRNLRTGKGEFESQAEYAARMKAADEEESQLEREKAGEDSRVAQLWDRKIASEAGPAREALEAALDEELSETAPVILGDYDAEAQEFPATFSVDGRTRSARLGVARKDAPAAKAREMLATVVYRHKLEGGRPVPVDARISVRDAELGEVYSWSSGAGAVRRTRSAPAAPAKLELKAEFADADGDGRLAAGETAKLTVTVTNSGAGAAFGVSASLDPSSVEGLSYASRHFIGEVPPGSSRTAAISVKGLAGVGDASRALTVSAADANGFTADPLRVVFETRARRGARLALAEFKIKEAGGDGIVTPGELVDVLLRVRNDGAGAAQAADVKLSGQGTDLFVQGEARRALGALAPGQTAEIRYTVFSNTSLAADKMRFTAVLSEGEDTWEAPIEIPLRRSLGTTRELVVKGKNLPAVGAAAEAVQKPAAKGAARADAYAVILGAEDYPKAARVSHARRDAGAFREFAVSVLGVPNDPSHLFFLDEGVTLAELRKAFSPNGWLARRVGPESDIFVFYAGHGAPSLDGKGAYLVPQDGDPNYAVETGFLVDDMLQALSGSKARSATVWLDACFSGADRESKPLLADARPLMLKADVRVPEGKVALFSAASGAQVSSAYPDKRHGLFTWFALRGLDGEADADKDGALTAGELADFMSKNVSRTAGSLDREQTPGFRGDRARVLANYRR